MGMIIAIFVLYEVASSTAGAGHGVGRLAPHMLSLIWYITDGNEQLQKIPYKVFTCSSIKIGNGVEVFFNAWSPLITGSWQ